MLLAGLPSRLQKALSEVALVSNSKLVYTVDRLTASIGGASRGAFIHQWRPSTFQFLVYLLSLPDCRAVVEDVQPSTKKRQRKPPVFPLRSRLLRPLFDTLNQTILWLYDAHTNGELSAEDLLQSTPLY